MSDIVSTIEKLVIGKSVADAEVGLAGIGYSLRETLVDGESVIVTMDLDDKRVNVVVENEIVVGVEGIG